MTQQMVNSQLIETRFKHLFIDLKAIKKIMAEITERPKNRDIVIDRELLAVEKQARREKKINRQIEQDHLDSTLEDLHRTLEQQLTEELKDTNILYQKVLGIDAVIPELLDLLAVKACTISRLEALAVQIPWLYKDLLKMVNSPKYQRVDSHGKVLTANTLRVALSFFGVEKLKMVIPFLIVRRCLPKITDPYPRIKHRIWEQAIATAMTSKNLASFSGVEKNQAFTLGIFQVLGKIAVVKLYFKLFDQVQIATMKEAHDKLQHKQHAALAKIEPSGEFLNVLLDKYAASTLARLIKYMDLRRLPIYEAAQQLAQQQSVDELSGLSKVLKQATGYAQYRILKNHKLISMEEAKEYLRAFSLPLGALEVLKTTDSRSLNLK
ncbi:MAG: HD-like signal output (HDOD) protein [Paraglaciecola sp.]|jgi:HD-like signal output (HDOD) protein